VLCALLCFVFLCLGSFWLSRADVFVGLWLAEWGGKKKKKKNIKDKPEM
jgi:hypothetical protein